MKVWVAVGGEYSDQQVTAVWARPEAAIAEYGGKWTTFDKHTRNDVAIDPENIPPNIDNLSNDGIFDEFITLHSYEVHL